MQSPTTRTNGMHNYDRSGKPKQEAGRNEPGVGTRLLADIFIGMLGGFADSVASQTNSKAIIMQTIESNVNPIHALELMARIGRFVRDNATNPKDIDVITSMSGEIEIRVRRQVVAHAKKDFMRDECWEVRADARIASAMREPAKMF